MGRRAIIEVSFCLKKEKRVRTENYFNFNVQFEEDWKHLGRNSSRSGILKRTGLIKIWVHYSSSKDH